MGDFDSNNVIDIREHLSKLPKKAAEEIEAKVYELGANAANEISRQAETIEKFTESMGKIKVQYALLGAAAGAAAGALVAFKVAYSRAETKFSTIADDEIEEMKAYYQAKMVALDADKGKGDLEEIVKERGYSSPDVVEETPPMAVQPPTTVIERDLDEEPTEDPRPEARNIFREAEVTHEWDWHAERSRRSPDTPYVVHYDERLEFDSYTDVTLTYYEGDDVLCNERDDIIDPSDRDRLVGEKNLERFGHGSNDASIVYIRNDQLEILYEVVKSPNSFAEEVHGIAHDASYRRNLERMRTRERNEYED